MTRSALLVVPFAVLLATRLAALDISEATYEGRPHFVVHTENARWYYDRPGGGFSRLIDRDGHDWIAFRAEPLSRFPESAAAGYRGLPNLVFVGPEKGAGHPGFDRCSTEVVSADTLRTVSRSGRWSWSWVFTETTATFTMEKADPDHPWWFLYEGPIAGTFDPARKLWGTDQGGPIFAVPTIDEPRFGSWRWAYFGDREVPHVLFVAQHAPDDRPDTLWYLGSRDGGAATAPDGMVVFGLGRGPDTTPQFRGAGIRVTVGLLETGVVDEADHERVAALIEARLGSSEP